MFPKENDGNTSIGRLVPFPAQADVGLGDTRMAQPRVVIWPGDVLNSGENSVALRQTGIWLNTKAKNGRWTFRQNGRSARAVVHLNVESCG